MLARVNETSTGHSLRELGVRFGWLTAAGEGELLRLGEAATMVEAVAITVVLLLLLAFLVHTLPVGIWYPLSSAGRPNDGQWALTSSFLRTDHRDKLGNATQMDVSIKSKGTEKHSDSQAGISIHASPIFDERTEITIAELSVRWRHILTS